MWRVIRDAILKRRALARACREDARRLLAANPHTAYYDAQRLAARARLAGDGRALLHWARVAAEIARLSDYPMDLQVVRAIVAEEEARAKGGGG